MNFEEVIALRKAFNSVKERQVLNPPKDFSEKKLKLISSRKSCVGNNELLAIAIEKLKKNGIKVHLVIENQEAIDIILG